MLNPYCFTDRNLKIGFIINLESHYISHDNSRLTIEPKFPEFGIEFRYIKKISDEMAIISARSLNQHKYKYQTAISTRFDKQIDDNQLLDETELFINLNINHNLTESDLDNFDVKSSLEHQIQQQEMKENGWSFDKISSMTIYFYKTGELNGTSYVKIPLKSSAICIIENNDKCCFIWSIIAYLHPIADSKTGHATRISNYRQYFKELNNQDFDFTNGYKCSYVHILETLNSLILNIFELNFYQYQNKWQHKLIPIEVSKNISDICGIIDIQKWLCSHKKIKCNFRNS